MRPRQRLHRFAIVGVACVALGLACAKGTEPAAQVPTSIVLSASAVALDAIGATQQLTATVKDQSGNTIATATVTWSSSNAAVATVSGTGVVTAVTAGTADVRASSGSVQSPAATVTVAPVAALLVKMAGDQQTGTVGQALGAALVVLAQDRLANPIPGATVNFSVTQGGGSVGSASATTGATGQASTTWTLGTTAGTNHQVTASAPGGSAPPVTFGATGTAAAAATILLFSGSGQQGIINQPLPAPIVARVNDQFGNPVSGRTVNFVVTTGGGSVNPASPTTGANGQAQTTWTLGSTIGGQTLEARAPGLTGSPIPFGAAATDLQITTITPDPVVEGQSATINGTGFSTTPASNAVSVGGAAATVTAATTTSLTITVPQTNCQPARDAGVTVTVGSTTSNSVTKRVNPPSFLALAVGEQKIIQDPTQFCLQFAPSLTGGDAYIVGVGASAETPSSTLPFTMTGVAGASSAAAAVAARPLALAAGAGGGSFTMPDPEFMARRLSQLRAEQTLREWERGNLGPGGARVQAAPAIGQVTTAVPNVGDIIAFKVPTDFSNPCNVFTTVGTKVRAVGTAGIWVTDTLNPTADSLTIAQIQAYSDTFDTKIYATDTLYFGKPSDIDANLRVFIVLTVQVNKITSPPGVAGFVFGGDILPSGCPQSNTGEIFYSHVPDSLNAAGTGARPKSGILRQMPSLIAHEFSHNIQQSRRLVLASGTSLTSWEAEGQAELAEEVVGHSVLGNMPGQNYGASVALAANLGDRWYGFAGAGGFYLLPSYYGWLGGTSKAANAPDLCTLFGSTSLVTACNAFAFYGASWAFQRYLADRFGAGPLSYPGGEAGLNRDLIGKNVTLRGVPNIQGLGLGVSFDSLFSQWGAMLYVDGRVGGAPAALTMASWDMFNVFSSFSSDALRLVPPVRTFAAFADSRSVRSGSNAYTVLSAAAARPALGLRVRDASDAALATGMRPQLWIVRLQ